MQNEINELLKYLNTNHKGGGPLPYEFTATEGKQYFKIMQTSGPSTSVYAFIAKIDFENRSMGRVHAGQVFKPAGWKRPARHSRGELLDKSTWAECFGTYGVAYIR